MPVFPLIPGHPVWLGDFVSDIRQNHGKIILYVMIATMSFYIAQNFDFWAGLGIAYGITVALFPLDVVTKLKVLVRPRVFITWSFVYIWICKLILSLDPGQTIVGSLFLATLVFWFTMAQSYLATKVP